MKIVKVLEEILSIYKKYFSVVEQMGTISMSPKDKQRLEELEAEYNKLLGE